MKKIISTFLICFLVVMSSFVQSPFSAIVSTSSALYATYQIKITYLGAQEKACISLLLYGSGRLPNGAEFIPYRNPAVNYNNDELPFNEIALSGTTIKKFVDALNLRSEIKVLGGTNEPELSLMIQKGIAPTEVVFEHLANKPEAHTIINILEGAISAESTTVKTKIRRFRNQSIGHH